MSDELKPIQEVLKKHGLSVDDFVLALKEGLKANKRMFDRDGDLIDDPEPDHSTRHKFFNSGMVLLGYLKESEVNINFTAKTIMDSVEEASKRAQTNRVESHVN